MKINSAKFVVSNSQVDQCPKNPFPEYAFIGRSNVGKSSLINMIANQKDLAKTSGRPGKTQLINHFLINNNWFLVDLPGYGYAKVSKSHRREFAKLIKAYFTKRKQLICAFVLIDIRHSAQKNDLEFMAWLNELGIAFYIVFTKSDKLKGDQIQTTVANYNKELQDYGWIECPKTLITSSTKYTGKEELLDEIERLNQRLFKS
ncbi:MAG: YihA family ribosome biogenesis GTP-binding protein [Flavobacteriaceae bacterium]|nr:YihA family ribosome biogenesis GTP-binding protein [Flavobacteriaceae bacterium]